MSSDIEMEQKIQDKGLNAPRLTPQLIASVISHATYHVFEDSCLTVCCLTLLNGFTVTGESACASPENFDKEIGQEIAYDTAVKKVWMLEGYLLKQKLLESVPAETEDSLEKRLLKEGQIRAVMDPDVYESCKNVIRVEMALGEYNDYRGWSLPADEDGSDEGYLVQYLDGGKSNHPWHSSYISWSPKAPFDSGYNKT